MIFSLLNRCFTSDFLGVVTLKSDSMHIFLDNGTPHTNNERPVLQIVPAH